MINKLVNSPPIRSAASLILLASLLVLTCIYGTPSLIVTVVLFELSIAAYLVVSAYVKLVSDMDDHPDWVKVDKAVMNMVLQTA